MEMSPHWILQTTLASKKSTLAYKKAKAKMSSGGNNRTPESGSESHGFNFKRMACGTVSVGQFLSGFQREKEKWIPNGSPNLEKAFACDPRTCMKSDRKVGVAVQNDCDPVSCGEIYFCDECTRCKKHCTCSIDDNSICDEDTPTK